MWSAGLEFSRRSLFLSLRMMRWVFPVIALLSLVSGFATPEGGQGLASVHPVFLAAMIVLIPILLSMQVCLGFSLYHGQSPANRAFVEHAVKHAPGVIGLFLMVAVVFAFAMLIPMALLTAVMPPLLGPLLLGGAAIAQMFGYITVARFVNDGSKIAGALPVAFRFFLQNKGVLLVATLLVVILPLVIDFASDIMAFQLVQDQSPLVPVWRYLVQVPVMALTTSLAAAAGVIAVTEGDWANTDPAS